MSIRRQTIPNTFQELVHSEFGISLTEIKTLKADASDRKIFRLVADNKTLIGIYNEDPKENLAFISFTKTFLGLGLNVPTVFRVSEDNLFYIEEDLGDSTLFNITSEIHNGNYLKYYKQALADLIRFQIETADKLNFDYCYQTREFDSEMVRSDLLKFKEYFSGLNIGSAINEEINEVIIEYTNKVMAEVRSDFFLYRDFQPRNIMIKDNRFYYIDYQSGRKGPLQYDVASFLYSGSISITDYERKLLLDFYIDELRKYTEVSKEEFMKHFYFFVLIRLLQMLGSYAYLSLKRNDKNILKKIPKAMINIKSISDKIDNEEITRFVTELTG